jgi:hypothetical protein
MDLHISFMTVSVFLLWGTLFFFAGRGEAADGRDAQKRGFAPEGLCHLRASFHLA